MDDLVFKELSDYVKIVFYREHCLYLIHYKGTIAGYQTWFNPFNYVSLSIMNESKIASRIDEHFRENKKWIDVSIDKMNFMEEEIKDLGLEFRKGQYRIENDGKNLDGHRYLRPGFLYGNQLVYCLEILSYTSSIRLHAIDPKGTAIIDKGVFDDSIEIIEKIRSHFIDNNIAKVLDGVNIYG